MKVKLIILKKLFLKKEIYFKQLFSSIFLIFILLNFPKKKVGVIGLEHSINIGNNNLLKYAMHIILSKLGYDPYIIGMRYNNQNISFIKSVTNLRLYFT